MREDNGEIELSKRNKLPLLILLKDIRGDLHCHTKETDGNATIQMMVEKAKKLGYQYIAITDHSRHLAMTRGLDEKTLLAQIKLIDKPNSTMNNVQFRFYEELNDFLPVEKQKVCFTHIVPPKTAIKDVIESLGVPHTEIDLILVNGKSVDFSYQVQSDDYISVYPVFEGLDISQIIHLRAEPLRKILFILDSHLGKLAKRLRLLGFDSEYDNHFSDEIIAMRSQKEKRIVLTRDIGLLKHKIITHGYWVRHTVPEEQIFEVLQRFNLITNAIHSRCILCNGTLNVLKNQILLIYLH